MNLKAEKYSRKIPVIFVIVLVIIMLGAFIPPLISKRERCHNPSYSCSANLKQIGLALKMYAIDYKYSFPPEDCSKGLEKLRKLDYLTDYSVYICPNAKQERGQGILTEKTCGYIYLGGFKSFDNPDIPLAFDKPGNHADYISVLFLDGHVERNSIPAAENCAKIIIALNKKYDYSEKLYKLLLKKARGIDAAQKLTKHPEERTKQ